MTCDLCLGGRHTLCTERSLCDCSVCHCRPAALHTIPNPTPKPITPARRSKKTTWARDTRRAAVVPSTCDERLWDDEQIPELVLMLMQGLADECAG